MAGKRTALVFEDNPLVAMDAEESLGQLGFARILTATSEAVALGHAQYEAIDFALIAAQTWDGVGDEIAAVLAARRIPFGFGCDFADGSDRPSRWKTAAFLVRPFSADDIRELIEKLGLQPV